MEKRNRLYRIFSGVTVEFVTTTKREYDNIIVVKKEESKDYEVLLDLETWAFELFDKRNLKTAKDILDFYQNFGHFVTEKEFEEMPKMVESLSGTYCTGKVQSGEDWYYTYKNFGAGENFDVWNRLDQPNYPSMPNVCLVDDATMRLREKRNHQIPYSCYDPYTKTLRVETEISKWEYLKLEEERFEKLKKLREEQERKTASFAKEPHQSKTPKGVSNVDNTKTEEAEERTL